MLGMIVPCRVRHPNLALGLFWPVRANGRVQTGDGAAGKALAALILAAILSWGLSCVIAFLPFFSFTGKTETKKKKQ